MAVEPTVRTGSWPSFGDTAAWRSYNCFFGILTLDFNPQIQVYKLIFGGLLYIIKYSKKYHRREIFVNNLICFHICLKSSLLRRRSWKIQTKIRFIFTEFYSIMLQTMTSRYIDTQLLLCVYVHWWVYVYVCKRAVTPQKAERKLLRRPH